MLNKKEKTIVKIVLGILALATIVILGEMLVEVFIIKNETTSYFVQHFTAGICLMLVGFMAFLMPMVAKQKYSDNKGDDMMLIVAVLLILCGIVAIIWSYIG